MLLNFKSIFYILSIMIIATGICMLLPAIIDLITHSANYKDFFLSSLFTISIGIFAALVSKPSKGSLKVTTKDGIFLTALSWFIIVLFAALPLKYSNIHLSYTDAYFEAMSGITTTGATIIQDLSNLSLGIHLWRGLLQWIGGLGIIVTGIALLPALKIGGMDLFKVEAFDTLNLSVSRATKIASGILIIYFSFTFAIMILLMIIAKFSFFDALIHSMTTIATAGFSTKNGSIGEFHNVYAEIIISIGMIIGGLPYILSYYLIFFGNRKSFFNDHQVLGYFTLITIITIVISILLNRIEGLKYLSALRASGFTVISLMTGTGYITYNFANWNKVIVIILFFTMFIGGCSGSSACGIKVFRLQILYEVVTSYIKKTAIPHSVVLVSYNNKPLSNDTLLSIFAYFALFAISFTIISIILSYTNLDFTSAMSLTITSMANVGPAFGDMTDPMQNLSSLNNLAKWTMVIGMIIGRLEILGLFTILSKSFWEK